jgi:hypothetical protein
MDRFPGKLSFKPEWDYIQAHPQAKGVFAPDSVVFPPLAGKSPLMELLPF